MSSGAQRLLLLASVVGALAFAEPQRSGCPYHLAKAALSQTWKVVNPLRLFRVFMGNDFQPIRSIDQLQAGTNNLVGEIPDEDFHYSDDAVLAGNILLRSSKRGPIETSPQKTPRQWRVLRSIMGDNSLLMMNEGWGPLRARLSPYFSAEYFAKSGAGELIARVVQSRFDEITARMANAPEIEINPYDEIRPAIIDVVMRQFFGRTLPAPVIEALGHDLELVDSLVRFEMFSPFPVPFGNVLNIFPIQFRAAAAAKRVREFTHILLDQELALAPEQRTPIVRELIEHYTADGVLADRETVVNHMVGFIFGGFDSTTTTIANWLHAIGSNPENQALLARLDRSAPEWQQAFDESMRYITPPTVLARTLRPGSVFEGSDGPIEYPKKTTFVCCPFLMNRAARFGQDRTGYPVDEYHPQRYAPDNLAQHGLTFDDVDPRGFGRGGRTCIAKTFATEEIKIIVEGFLHDFEIVRVPAQPTIESRTFVRLSDDYRMSIRRRRSPTAAGAN